MRRLLALAAAALLPAAAGAGELRFAAEGGWFDLSASKQAARAVFGSSGGPVFGFDVGFGARQSGPFARLGVRHWKQRGERAFAVDRDSPPFRLGHPLEVRILPLYALVGWRLRLGAFTPYAGVGGGVTLYDEESTVAEVTTSSESNRGSFRVAGGVELLRGPLRLGVELGWTTVPDALGAGGLSERFAQTDAGGLSVVARVVFVP